MEFWATQKLDTFHASRDCVRVVARALQLQLRLVDLRDYPHIAPCTQCYPDAPKVPRTQHSLCQVCSPSTARPCGHNGGVLVEITLHRKNTIRQSPDAVRVGYVWPEDAWRYTSIEVVDVI